MGDEGDTKLEAAYEAALRLEKSGAIVEAIAAWQVVLAIDPADPGGAAVRLAALGHGTAPDKAPAAYVATLFDQHAEVFDGILVDQLEYGVPMLLRERFQDLAAAPFARMLDLGCGTGLAGEALEDMVSHFTGVDLAEGMIEIAGEKELYDKLFTADVRDFLDNVREDWDLIVATDVFPYLGDAAPLIRAVRNRIKSAGWFAFSTEVMPQAAFGDQRWMVTPYHRFAHQPDYIMAVLRGNGFELVEADKIMVRRERGNPIMGHLFICRVA